MNEPRASDAATIQREPTCYGYCGSLGWTIFIQAEAVAMLPEIGED